MTMMYHRVTIPEAVETSLNLGDVARALQLNTPRISLPCP